MKVRSIVQGFGQKLKKIILVSKKPKTNVIPEEAFIAHKGVLDLENKIMQANIELVQLAFDPKTSDEMRIHVEKRLEKLKLEDLADAFFAAMKRTFKTSESGGNTAGTLSSLGKNIHIVG